MEAEGAPQVIHALVPQRELHKYATVVQSLTRDQGALIEALDYKTKFRPNLRQRWLRSRPGARAPRVF